MIKLSEVVLVTDLINTYWAPIPVNKHQQCMKSTLPTLEKLNVQEGQKQGARWWILSLMYFILYVSSMSPGTSAVLSWACLAVYWSDPFVLTLSWGDGWQVIIYTRFILANGNEWMEVKCQKLSTCLNHVEWLSFLFSYISLHLSFRTYSTKSQIKKIKRSLTSGEMLNTVKLSFCA